MAPTCTNCNGTDFVWANELKTGMTGGGSLSLRARGEIPIGTRICRTCGHAELFLRDLSVLHQPHTWRQGEFIPIPSKPKTEAAPRHSTPAPAAPAPAVPASSPAPPLLPAPDPPPASPPSPAPAPPSPPLDPAPVPVFELPPSEEPMPAPSGSSPEAEPAAPESSSEEPAEPTAASKPKAARRKVTKSKR